MRMCRRKVPNMDSHFLFFCILKYLNLLWANIICYEANEMSTSIFVKGMFLK